MTGTFLGAIVVPRARCGALAVLTFVLIAFVMAAPGPAAAEDRASCDAAAPLRTVNLNPFHIAHGPPSSFGACVLSPDTTEFIASVDIASHMGEARSGREHLWMDGETSRYALAARQGFRDGWEYLLELSVVSHSAGMFDGFIENWHSAFGLPQGGRDSAPRDRLAIGYARNGQTRVDIRDKVDSIGDLRLGIGHDLGKEFLSNDGLALRGMVRLPTGDEDALAGSGGVSTAIWAETSGPLPGSRDWLYGGALGALAGSAPDPLYGTGGRFVAFGRLALTWRLLPRLSLTAQADAHSSPWRRSSLAPLAGPVIMFGMGGRLKISRDTTLEIAVTEDDGWRQAAPDVGIHAALRWTP